jgi:hypothetical protein
MAELIEISLRLDPGRRAPENLLGLARALAMQIKSRRSRRKAAENALDRVVLRWRGADTALFCAGGRAPRLETPASANSSPVTSGELSLPGWRDFVTVAGRRRPRGGRPR